MVTPGKSHNELQLGPWANSLTQNCLLCDSVLFGALYKSGMCKHSESVISNAENRQQNVLNGSIFMHSPNTMRI